MFVIGRIYLRLNQTSRDYHPEGSKKLMKTLFTLKHSTQNDSIVYPSRDFVVSELPVCFNSFLLEKKKLIGLLGG